MSDFNYIEYLRNNPLLKKDNPKIITESQEESKSSKMKKSELKAKIREEILATLNEEEDYERMGREVEYGIGAGSDEDDLDMEDIFGAYDDEDFESMGDEDMDEMYLSEQNKDKKEDAPEEEEDAPEEEEMDVDVDVAAEEPMAGGGGEGLSSEEQKIQNNLKVAYDNAIAIGDQKLADQIGNSITFFTRTHVVER